ncbi:MAG TPA: AAA family ATPase [Symbiobacteriaceae bacterium]|nr:AAA family ATPase [Symbiobacteriaceae bacterium]
MSLVIPSNPFRKPAADPIFAKVGYYAGSGVGKTHFALQAPTPAVIDPERGTQWFRNRSGFSDWEVMEGLTGDVVDQVHAGLSFLEAGFEAENVFDLVLKRNVPRITAKRAIDPSTTRPVHPYETLVIDPVTLLWESIQFVQSLKVERSNRDNKEDFSWKDHGDMKRDYKGILNRLLQLPMNVIVTARSADVTDNGKKTGTRADAEKSTIYAFDLFFELTNPQDRQHPERRDAIILKDRSQTYRQGDIVKNVSWATLVAPILTKLGGRKELDEAVKIMARTWRSKSWTDMAARAVIEEQTGKSSTQALTMGEIQSLTKWFETQDGGETGAGSNPAGGAASPGAEPGGTGDTGQGE